MTEEPQYTGTPRPTPDQFPEISELDARREKYVATLDRIEEAQGLDELYPEGIASRHWSRVTNEQARKDFLASLDTNKAFNLGRIDVYADENGQMYAGPMFTSEGENLCNLTRIFLDALASLHDTSPWMEGRSIHASHDEAYFSRPKGAYDWEFQGDNIIFAPASMEYFASLAGRDLQNVREAIAWVGAKIAHESVHMHNKQDMPFGGDYPVTIGEICSVTEEYLRFPGLNSEPDALLLRGIAQLRAPRPANIYASAMLIGSMIMAEKDNMLNTSSIEAIESSLSAWRTHLLSMDSEAQREYRERMENDFILSEDDGAVTPLADALIERCPALQAMVPLPTRS